MEITSGHAPRGPTEVMVDADTAEKHHLKLGDELRTIAVTGDFTAKISGIASFKVTNPGAAVVYFDTATAQRKLLGKAGPVHARLRHRRRRASATTQLKQNVAAALGSGPYKLQTAKEAADASREDVGSFLDVMKYAMLGFAGIALLVGIFLIVNTFSMLVAQRTREIGLMRAIGSSRKQVNRSVLVEALLLGVVGSVAGRRRRRRPGRRADEADGLHGHGAVHPGPDRRVDDAGRSGSCSASSSPSSPRTSRRGGPARSPRWPPCATPVRPADGKAGPDPGRASAWSSPAAARPRSAGRHPGRQGERGLAVPRPGRGPHPHRLRRHRPAARRRRGAGARRASSCGCSARSAASRSATRCATRAVPEPPAPP